jgi:hypothetical protein
MRRPAEASQVAAPNDKRKAEAEVPKSVDSGQKIAEINGREMKL